MAGMGFPTLALGATELHLSTNKQYIFLFFEVYHSSSHAKSPLGVIPRLSLANSHLNQGPPSENLG